jgi:hypothetical protein
MNMPMNIAYDAIHQHLVVDSSFLTDNLSFLLWGMVVKIRSMLRNDG